MSFGDYPPQWLALAGELLKGRIILVLGSVDTGKTTLVTYLANSLVKRGKRVAIVDADVGQSDIGPPTTIGLGLVESPIKKMREAKRLAMYFVGAISPEGYLLPMVVGTKKMVEKGLSFADLILIDPTGLIQGAKGQALKHHKIELVNPDRIIILQKERELEPLIAPFEGRGKIVLHRLGVAEQIRNKTKEERRKRREEGVFNYFKDSGVHELSTKDKILINTFLGQGKSLQKSEIRFLSDNLQSFIFHAELTPESLFVVTEKGSSPGRSQGFSPSLYAPAWSGRSGVINVAPTFRENGANNLFKIRSHFKRERVHLISIDYFKSLLLGLISAEGELLELGIIKEFDLLKKRLSLFTPLKEKDRIRSIQFSEVHLDLEGREMYTS